MVEIVLTENLGQMQKKSKELKEWQSESSNKLENVAIANALKLQAARRRTVPIPFIFVSSTKFELAQPIRCRLRAFLLLVRYVTLWPWTLTPVTLTFDLEHM